MTAPSTTSEWGYVFHSCTIDGNVTGYTLGRSWNNAKAVFINTTMNTPDEKDGESIIFSSCCRIREQNSSGSSRLSNDAHLTKVTLQ